MAIMADSTFHDDTILIPGPSFHIDLSAYDACHPVHYSRRLLIFHCASSTQRDAQLAALKTGLQGLVLRCPILGGIIVSLPPDAAVSDGHPDWRTIVPDRGIELVVRDLRTAMPSFEELKMAEFPASQLPFDLLVPIPQNLGNDRPFAACKVQFSAIDGGTIVTFAMSHSVADGAGANELMHILSEETRYAQELSIDGVTNEVHSRAVTMGIVGHDRSVIRNMTNEIAFNIEDHPGYRWKTTPASTIPPLEQAPAHPFEATSPEIPAFLRISVAGLAQLKIDATLAGAPPISTHDALSALLWRSVLLIRSRRSALAQDLPASTIGSLFLPSDGRRHLNLPPSYIGNAVYQLTATLNLDTLLSPSGLQYGASAIRRAITSVNPALVSSYIAMLNKKWIDWQFLSTMSTTGVAMGTSWTSGVVYSEDWGKAFGPLVSYRNPGGVGEASNWILPKLLDGGAELTVCVMPEEVTLLKSSECFGKYLEM